MHHSLKIKIRDLDYIESIVEQDITDVKAKKILGGDEETFRIKVCAPDDYYCLMNLPPMPDDPMPPCSNNPNFPELSILTKSSINVLTKKLDLQRFSFT